MKRQELDRLKELARRVAALSGVELVDLEYGAARGGPVLRIYIDKEGGITVADCSRVSRAIGDALDTEDPLPFSYRLEVSSPGVDKPLKGEEDYKRFRGRCALFVLKRPHNGRATVNGVIGECGDGAVWVRTKHGEEISVGFGDIARARLDVDPWEMAKMKGKKEHAG